MLPPHVGSQPTRFTMPPLMESIFMSFGNKDSFKRFTHLGPSGLGVLLERMPMSFLFNIIRSFITWVPLGHTMLCNSKSIQGCLKIWWWSLIGCRPLDYLEMSWVLYVEAYFDRFVPYSLKDHMTDVFDNLEQDSMTILAYEAHFYALSSQFYANLH